RQWTRLPAEAGGWTSSLPLWERHQRAKRRVVAISIRDLLNAERDRINVRMFRVLFNRSNARPRQVATSEANDLSAPRNRFHIRPFLAAYVFLARRQREIEITSLGGLIVVVVSLARDGKSAPDLNPLGLALVRFHHDLVYASVHRCPVGI